MIFELTAAVLSALGVWLTAKRLRWCWPVGLVSVLLYSWVFIDARLYSDALLQAVFATMLIYGWFNWSRHLDQSEHVTIAHLSFKAACLHLLVGLAAALALGAFMAHYTNADLPRIDAALAAFSLVAQWWQARRHRAAWWLWISVDIIYVAIYVHKDLLITALLYSGFLGLAYYGLISWQKAAREQPSHS